MKLGILLTTVLLTLSAQAAPVGGFLVVEKDQYSFVEIKSNRKTPIRPTKLATVEALKKLKNMDYFQGQGEFVNNELLLESVDFVGLRRLLGLWTADENSVLDFQDYSRVMIYRSFLNLMAPRALLQYSIAPSAGADWRIFFTDENSVVLAALDLKDQKATLKFFDLGSGHVVKTVEMTRIPLRN